MLNGYTLKQLEEKIKYSFQDKELLRQAVTHSSYTNERKINKKMSYERLEFLGDAVLELVTSHYLFESYEELSEGELTKNRASLVCEQSLSFCARGLALGKYVFFGKGEEATGGRERDSIVADVMESIIGAIYLDGGFDAAKEFIFLLILSELESKKQFNDSKTILQEYVQGKNLGILQYDVVEQSGPDHNKNFVVNALIDKCIVGTGKGRTKKAAEQMAAYEALLNCK